MLLGSSFIIIGNEPVIIIVVRMSDDEFKTIVNSPARFVYNAFVKVFALVYEHDKTFSPGVIIDSEETARTFLSWLDAVISKQRCNIVFVRIKDNESEFVSITFSPDVEFLKRVRDDIKALIGEKK